MRKNKKNRRTGNAPSKQQQHPQTWSSTLGEFWPKQQQKSSAQKPPFSTSGKTEVRNPAVRDVEKSIRVNESFGSTQASRRSTSLMRLRVAYLLTDPISI